jgi:hypothetical protein
VEATPERLERGRYLVEHVLPCGVCHAGSVEESVWGGPPAAGLEWQGGLFWGEDSGFPGRLYSRNITPDVETGLGGWTDGEIMRAVREGVDRNGRALAPIMPYLEWRAISDEDAGAMVVYLRTLPPRRNSVPPPEISLSRWLEYVRLPEPLHGPVPAPDRGDEVAYGRYLSTIAGCRTCHGRVGATYQIEDEFGGGQTFRMAWGGTVRSPNLTPHATGLGSRTRENFVAIFKSFDDPDARRIPVAPEKNTVMPWLQFSGMTEADLGAIHAYLLTVKPVDNAVERWP